MKRIYSSVLKDCLGMFPCVALLGPRQCGKTTLVKMLGASWDYYDLERGSDFDAVERDPDLFLRLHPDQVVFDEAQRLPRLFDALRVAIDERRHERGRFVVTGSSSPSLVRSISESLAGRVAVIEMSPLMWAEVSGEPDISPLVRRIAAGNFDAKTLLSDIFSHGAAQAVHDYWVRGGYPEPWLRNDERFNAVWKDQYIATYLERDIASLFPGLNKLAFRKFIGMLGGLSGDVINYAHVARALGVSQPTARDYFEIAHGTFLWRQLPAFDRNPVKRIVKHAKGYLRDSGLLHRLLHIPDQRALLAHPRFAWSWEGMVMEELIRQFSCAGKVDAYYYRTSGGAEVDLILEGAFGLLPVEIKYGQRVDQRDLRALKDFMAEYSCPLGLVIHNDVRTQWYTDNIAGIPFGCL